jgi:hypothetical protein
VYESAIEQLLWTLEPRMLLDFESSSLEAYFANRFDRFMLVLRLERVLRGVVDGVESTLFCIPDAKLLVLLDLIAGVRPML